MQLTLSRRVPASQTRLSIDQTGFLSVWRRSKDAPLRQRGMFHATPDLAYAAELSAP